MAVATTTESGFNLKPLRICRGTLAGKPIDFKHPRVRPTRSMVREAMLDILISRGWLEAARVLIPFAGSGITGFDFISCGAGAITFIDSDREVIKQLRTNSNSLALQKRVEIVSRNVRSYHTADKFNGIVADPPYRSGWFQHPDWLISLAAESNPQWLALESDPIDIINLSEDSFGTGKVADIFFRKYGGSQLTFIEFSVQ